ncbi:S8 family serine peptidase [Actinoplanes derwentensis]|uniref:Subtilase family protein n=1 Tax=Actinoplanes derwentensis TaxID=113562 RepID=A0A1H2BCR7_9ACTN|nr:S8 family serine peptidase [Actinoplanes derwentensis]GID88645.1 hypothetical protein Ade03nite_75690 [Actinoplanes derwentensis]SDT56100.1 Subtilase family protein [Actinoplanes derwentensis]
MPATALRAVALALAAVAVTATGTALPARAEPGTDAAPNRYYYTVGKGAPENLWEIAERFLGDPERAGEILDLNAGRVQPDGGRLVSPDDLTGGWHLVLPGDAIGAELQHGPLPAGRTRPSKCQWGATPPAAATWGQTLLTPSGAWTVADGSGVKVAIVGSGVDGSATGLTGRVLAGTDVTSGTGRGDDSCAGSGTALAGIVAGDDGDEGRSFGVAPGARIVPVKAGTGKPTAGVAATAIRVAAASGAGVVLIGADVDATDPQVGTAINKAIAADVVVVLPATAAAGAADGLLRVGAAGRDGQPAGNTAPDAADLLAPGDEVASIGRAGSGPAYAAAFVAGTITLVRSADPGLPATEVTRRVLATAVDGVVSPVAAVTTPQSAEPAAAAGSAPEPRNGLGTLSTVLIGIAAGLIVLLSVLLVSRRWQRRRAPMPPPGQAG